MGQTQTSEGVCARMSRVLPCGSRNVGVCRRAQPCLARGRASSHFARVLLKPDFSVCVRRRLRSTSSARKQQTNPQSRCWATGGSAKDRPVTRESAPVGQKAANSEWCLKWEAAQKDRSWHCVGMPPQCMCSCCDACSTSRAPLVSNTARLSHLGALRGRLDAEFASGGTLVWASVAGAGGGIFASAVLVFALVVFTRNRRSGRIHVIRSKSPRNQLESS